MILTTLVAASLIVPVATNSSAMLPSSLDRNMSMAQKRAVLRPLVSTVTTCIARSVSTDVRFPGSTRADDVNELIVDSIPRCMDEVQSLIDAYDQLFGSGAGESYFLGPFLDHLPAAVDRLVHGEDSVL
jgi:hypothetical protein